MNKFLDFTKFLILFFVVIIIFFRTNVLDRKITSLTNNLKFLQSDITFLSEQLGDSRQAVYTLMAEVLLLKTRNKDSVNTINRYKKDLDSHELNVKIMSDKISQLIVSNNENTKLQHTVHLLTKDLSIYQEKQEVLRDTIKDQKTNLITLNDRISATEKLNKKPLYEDLKSHIMYVVQGSFLGHYFMPKGAGTGVVVKKTSDTSYILTNKHVCNENNKGECFVEIMKYGQFLKIPLTFVKQHESNYDLALWKTSEFLPGKKEINGIAEAKQQDKVYSVGNYLGFKYLYTEGTFSGYELNYAIANLPCAYGCSGSAVFDKDENMIGLIFAVNILKGFQADTSKAVMIPSEIIRNFLKDYR